MSTSRSNSPVMTNCSPVSKLRIPERNRDTLHDKAFCEAGSGGEESYFVMDSDARGAFVFCSKCDFKIYSSDEIYDCLLCEKSFTPPKQIIIRSPMNSLRRYTNKYCATCYIIMKEERAKTHKALMISQIINKKPTNFEKQIQDEQNKILLQKFNEKRKALFNARYPPISPYIN